MTKTLTLLDNWTAPSVSGGTNEDGWGVNGTSEVQRAFVIDGCTDYDRDGSAEIFPGATSSAFWHKEQLLAALMQEARSNQDLARFVRSAAERLRSGYETLTAIESRPIWALPCSTLGIIEIDKQDQSITIVTIGDTAVLLEKVDGTITRLPSNTDDADGELKIASLIHRPEMREEAQRLRRARREHFIKTGTHCISVFPDRLSSLATTRVSLNDYVGVLMATDGFMRLVDVFGTYSDRTLIAAASERGLAALGTELRELELDNSVDGATARIKSHDDATAIRFSF